MQQVSIRWYLPRWLRVGGISALAIASDALSQLSSCSPCTVSPLSFHSLYRDGLDFWFIAVFWISSFILSIQTKKELCLGIDQRNTLSRVLSPEYQPPRDPWKTIGGHSRRGRSRVVEIGDVET